MQDVLGITKNEQLLQGVLIKTKWDVTTAMDYYFANGVDRQVVVEADTRVNKNFNKTKAEALFDKYKKGTFMEEDGIAQFWTDIGVDMEQDIVSLMGSYYMQTGKDNQIVMGEYRKNEFLKGCEALGCDDIASWKTAVTKLRTELKQEARYKEMYKFVFGFACDKGMRSLEIDAACALWPMLLGEKCKFLCKWIEFIESKQAKKEITIITKDTWDLFYDLTMQTKGNFDNFEDDGAWPILVDQFCEYYAK